MSRAMNKKTLPLCINTTSEDYWTTNQKQEIKSYKYRRDTTKPVHWIEILTSNTLHIYNEKAYSQIIGIPMGTNCAEYIANFIVLIYKHVLCFLVGAPLDASGLQ
jgi:hypothetical protein